MFELKLTLIDLFDSEFKGKSYKNAQFIDCQSLTIIYGSFEKEKCPSLTLGKDYTCECYVSNNKIKVRDVKI